MNFLKNIADKAKSVADSPLRTFSRTDESPSGSQEGFICPLCIGSFATPEGLQSHYESSHSGGEADLAKTSPTLDKRSDLHAESELLLILLILDSEVWTSSITSTED